MVLWPTTLTKGYMGMSISTIGVVGAGQMGAGIAHVAAVTGLRVFIADADQDRANAGKAGILKRFDRAEGAFRRSLVESEVRVDFVQHSLSALLMTQQLQVAESSRATLP